MARFFQANYDWVKSPGVTLVLGLCCSLMQLQAEAPKDFSGFEGLGQSGLSLMPEMPDKVKITHGGTIDYQRQKQTVTYTGSPLVHIVTDTGAEIFSRKAVVDLKSKRIIASGDIAVFQGGTLTRGELVTYDWQNGALDIQSLRTKVNQFLLESGKFSMQEVGKQKVFVGENAGVTTEDLDYPSSWLRSSRTSVYVGDRVDFKNLKVYAGDTPIFYLPSFSRPLNPYLGWLPQPAGRSQWGSSLLNTYGFIVDEKRIENGIPTGDYLGRAHFDMRSLRGFATGLDVVQMTQVSNDNLTGFKSYYAQDADPGTEILGETRTNVPDRERYMLQLRERFWLREKGPMSWRFDVDSTILSDEYMLEDFFPREYNRDARPDNMLAVVGSDETRVITAMWRFAGNDFYQSQTRQEMYYDVMRRPVYDSRVLYESSTSFGVLKQNLTGTQQSRLADLLLSLDANDPRRPIVESLVNTDSFSRLHSYHEWSLPGKLGNYINLTSKAGVGYTGYYGLDEIGADHRASVFAGVFADTKIKRAFSDVKSRKLGLDGLLHVVEPYVGLSVLNSNDLDSSIPTIDGWTTTTRPNSISVGRFTQVDDLSSWTVARYGVRNVFATHRDGGSLPWLTMDTYLDSYINDPEWDRNLSNLYADVFWTPVPWTRLDVQSQFPVASTGYDYTEVSTTARFMPAAAVEFNVGHRYLSDHPILEDTNLCSFGGLYRLNQAWAFGAQYRVQFADSSLERQEYTLWHDTGVWVIGAGVYARYARETDKNDYGFMLNFVLKEFSDGNISVKMD